MNCMSTKVSEFMNLWIWKEKWNKKKYTRERRTTTKKPNTKQKQTILDWGQIIQYIQPRIKIVEQNYICSNQPNVICVYDEDDKKKLKIFF